MQINRTLTVDTVYPQISFVSPTPENNSGAQSFQVNTTITDLNLKNASYNFNGTSYWLTAYSPAQLTNGLVLLMNFDNQTEYGENDTYFLDSSGNGNNGTAYGGAVLNASGKYNSAISFDGVDDSVDSLFTIQNFNQLTITLWDKSSIDGQNPSRISFDLLSSRLLWGDSGIYANGWIVGTESIFLDDNTWHLYTLVVDNFNGGNWSIYRDNILQFNTNYTFIPGSDSLRIGGHWGSYFNGSIDEVMIWNRSLSAEEINVLYQSQLKNYLDTGVAEIVTYPTNNSNISLHLMDMNGDGITSPNFNFWVNQTGGMGIGLSYNYFMKIYDLAGNSNQTETRIIKGNSAPSVASLTQTPSSYNDLDPGVSVAVTINVSDPDDNFDSAVLQWKNSTSDWTSLIMDNITAKSITTRLNTSFTLPDYEANITYRIYTNDTLGDSRYGSNYTISSYWDCGWTATSDLGAVAGWTSSDNKNAGTLIINNTGDSNYSVASCSLDFRLTHSLTEGRIYFDGDYVKPSDTYTVPANSSQSIEVNATFLNEITSESVIITTTEIRSRTNTTSRNTTLAVVSNQNGPYLYEKITSSPSTVYLTAGTISLESYIRNLMGSSTYVENRTAFNVTFYWDLPAGLTNSSGNLTGFYENLSDSNVNSLNAEIEFSSLASFSPGTTVISLKAYGYNSSGGLITDVNNNTLLTEEVNITFSCYNVSDGVYVTACGAADGDYVAPTTTTTTGGSGGGGGSSGGKTSVSEASYEMLRGGKQEFTFDIKNKYPYDLKDITIKASGLNAQYLDIEPKEIALIPGLGSKPIQIKVSAPSYFNAKNYSIVFEINGVLDFNNSNQNFYEKKTVTLYILDIPREEASQMLEESTKMLEEMNSSQMILKESLALFEKINASYSNIDFNALKKEYTTLKTLYDAAFESKALIEELTLAVAESERNGIKVDETKKSLYVAEVIYKRGDYLSALDKLKKAKLTYGLETKGEFNLIYSVKNNPVQSLGFLILAGFIGMSGSLLFRFQLYKKRISILKKEEVLLLQLMKLVQKECFENNKMSMEEYNQAMSQYEKRLADTIQSKIETETKLVNLFKFRGKRIALDEERKKLVLMIKQLQEDYLIKGNVETRVYENMLKSYTTRLGMIDESIATADAQSALRKSKSIRKLKIK